MKQETETQETKTANLIKQLQGMQSSLFVRSKDRSFSDISVSYDGIVHLQGGAVEQVSKVLINYDKNKTYITLKRVFVVETIADLLNLDMGKVISAVEENRLYDAYNLFCASFCKDNKNALFTELK